MKRRRANHLNELMIVNPGLPNQPQAVYLGKDGYLYEAPGLGELAEPPAASRLFLGEDGMLYEMRGHGLGALPATHGQLLLGEDGMLYEIVD